MKNIKKTIHNYFVFILGIIFASCITALAETCNTTVSSNNVSYTNVGTTQNANAAIAALTTKINSLDSRMTAATNTLNGKLSSTPSGVEFGTGSSSGHGGYIDFHFNGSGDDYTSRIIETKSGVIDFKAPSGLKINGYTLTSPTKFTPTISTGSLLINSSFYIGATVHLSFTISGATISTNTTTVVATLPSSVLPGDVASCAVGSKNSSNVGNCWVRANGQVCILSVNGSSGQDITITGDYLR
jgi:hypothetical protein